ncbi:PREDICTED: glucoamylase-like [Rhinopithecus bieti]|uniref:glucoamylase-like n=1 Tax=Rhinopithecus bieti TaxID=61621 RepID=UPI00083C5289|nr:PREDICTED: glucoamylase-like [Rhinopithecus bieti]
MAVKQDVQQEVGIHAYDPRAGVKVLAPGSAEKGCGDTGDARLPSAADVSPFQERAGPHPPARGCRLAGMAPGVTSGPAPPPSGPAPWGGLAASSEAGARYLCHGGPRFSAGAADADLRIANPAGEVFAICGSCDALGNWNPQNAVALLPENDTGESMLWKATIVLSRGVSVQYRYFKGYFLEPKKAKLLLTMDNLESTVSEIDLFKCLLK